MAVLKQSIALEHYIGLSTDTKPTGVPVGSTYRESNTGHLFVCYDGTLWAAIDNTSVV